MKVAKYVEDMKTYHLYTNDNDSDTTNLHGTSSLARTRDLMSATSTKLNTKVKEKNNAHDTCTAYSGRLDPWSGPGMTALGKAGNESDKVR